VPPAAEDVARFFDTAPVGMYRSTAAGRFVFVNRALVTLLGYDRVEDVLALDIPRDVYVDPTDRARWIARGATDELGDGVDLRWRTRTGEILTVRLYVRAVKTPAGELEYETTVFDVTELHQRREQVEHTATTLALLLGQIPAVLWTTDCDLRITSSGGAIRELLDSTPNRSVGMTMAEYLHTDDPDHVVIGYHRRALAGEVVAYEIEWHGRLFASRLGPRRSTDGTLIGTIGTAIDVSASRDLERRMAEAVRAERLGVLAGGLAHDFNNLLVAILGNADLALRDPAASRDLIANIRVAAMRAGELTQQLLAYAGGEVRDVADVDAVPVIGELVEVLRASTPAGVALRDDVPAQLPPVRADASQLRQVVLNLITNARDAVAARGGVVRIDARVVDHDGAVTADDVVAAPVGRYVAIAVTDDGAGIDPGVRQKIFDPFFTTKASGHGLGLAAVLGIVRDHGGALRVANQAGGGARFEAWWPTAVREPNHRLPTPVPTPVLNVMVVDDDDLVRDVLSRMVEDLGYAVIAVADGAEAIAIAERAEVAIDAVILDLTMPQMPGRMVMAELRARRPELPIVLCSGYERERDAAAAAGDAFLRKPFRIEELERLLAEVTR